MVTNFLAKLVTPLLFGTLTFRNGLDDRNSVFEILNSNDVATFF